MPRPILEGRLIRQIDMHHSSAGKNKDYRISVTQSSEGGYRVYSEHGPAGKLNQGQQKTKREVSWSGAKSMAEALIAEKRSQTDAYQVVSDQMLSEPASANAAPPSPPLLAPSKRVTFDSLSAASRAKLVSIF